MRAQMLAGAVAAVLYGGGALAEDCPPKQDTQAQLEPQSGTSSGVVIGEQPLPSDVQQQKAQGVGGSGSAGTSGSTVQGQQPRPPPQQGEVLLRCTPVNNAGVGGSGAVAPQGLKPEPSKAEEKETATGGGGVSEHKLEAEKRGVTVLVGGGIEGYTRELAPDVNPGPAVNVTAALRPSSVLGLEVSYTGAANNIGTGVAGGARSGPDIIRNGGQAAATFGLTASNVQPYVLGGIGVSYYNVRTGLETGFRSDTVGNVPVGAGVRTHFGHFTADARLHYNFLFDQEFAARAPFTGVGAPGNSGFAKGGSYLGTVNVGTTF